MLIKISREATHLVVPVRHVQSFFVGACSDAPGVSRADLHIPQYYRNVWKLWIAEVHHTATFKTEKTDGRVLLSFDISISEHGKSV